MYPSPQPAPGPPPYGGQPAYGPPPGTGRLVVEASYLKLAWFLMMTKPRISIDYRVMPSAAWGRNTIDLPPGEHHVYVSTQYMGNSGPAEAMIPIRPGQQTVAY